jgi:hypothetical protein
MMKGVYTGLLFMLTIFAGRAQEFTVSTKSGVDMKTYETFTVVKGDILAAEDRAIDGDAFFQEIRMAIVRELEVRGYKFIEEGPAQLAVSYVVETMVKFETQPLGPLGQTPVTNPAMVDASPNWSKEFRQGSLIIDIVDTDKKSAVWSAEGTIDITRSRGGNVVDYAVRMAFRKFPDKTKKEKKPRKSKN